MKECTEIPGGAFVAARMSTRGYYDKTIEDLDQSTQIFGDLYKTLPQNLVDRATFFEGLGKSYCRRYELGGSVDDLQKGIEELGKACLVIDSMVYPSLGNLSHSLNLLYEENHEERALIESIESIEKALESLDDDHPEYEYYSGKLNDLRQKHK